LGVALAWPGCGGEKSAAPSESMPAPAVPEPAASDDGMALTGEGFEIVFHDEGFTGTEFQQPSMVIQAGNVNLSDSGEYFLENVTATIYREGQPETTLVAGRGEVNEDEGIARLSNGVTVDAGDMHLELDHIEWQNNAEPPQAVSDAPVRLRQGESDLAAKGLVLIPVEQS